MIWLYPITKEENDREFTYDEIMELQSKDEMYAFDESYDIKQMFEFELMALDPKKSKYVAFIVFDIEKRTINKVSLKPVVEETIINRLFKVDVVDLTGLE